MNFLNQSFCNKLTRSGFAVYIVLKKSNFCDKIAFRYELTSGLTEWRCSEDAEWVPITPDSNISRVPVCSPSKFNNISIY